MQIEIPEIVDRLNEHKCVFLLGPALAKNENGETMQSCLTRYFKEKQLNVEEDSDDFYSCDQITKTRAIDHLQKYYRDHSEPNDSHKQLALIPCHLYISTTPDLLMKKALDEFGVDSEFEYYVKDKPPHAVLKPTSEKPLLYNLFGCIDNQASIIFNQWDLIQYLFSIIKEFKLPQNLRESLKNANYFIFLGFDFEKWYLKILLRLILEESKPSIATEEGQSFDEKIKLFYQKSYGLEFVDTNIDEYIDKLFNECEKREILRKKKDKIKPSIQFEIKTLIGRDDVKEAIERLIEFIENEKKEEVDTQEFLNELYIHSGTYNTNEKKLRKGMITEEAAKVERAKIRDALLNIAVVCS